MMTKKRPDLRDFTAEGLYQQAWMEHGPVPRGVGWRDDASQNKRFEVMFEGSQARIHSLLDVGCGYGALVQYLEAHRPSWFRHVGYVGVDSNPSPVLWAQEKLGKRQDKDSKARMFKAADIRQMEGNATFDMVVGSGILSYYDMPEKLDILDAMWARTRQVMVWNMRQNHQYLGDLGFILPRFHSEEWRVLHDYGLREMTVVVRKS